MSYMTCPSCNELIGYNGCVVVPFDDYYKLLGEAKRLDEQKTLLDAAKKLEGVTGCNIIKE